MLEGSRMKSETFDCEIIVILNKDVAMSSRPL